MDCISKADLIKFYSIWLGRKRAENGSGFIKLINRKVKSHIEYMEC